MGKLFKDIKVDQCYHQCPFFELDGGPGPIMLCGHPYFNNKPPYSGTIITHENSRGRVPDECPLRTEPCTTITTVRLIGV